MSIQAAKQELSSMTEFQREIHVTSDPSEEIISDFYKSSTKSTWHTSISVKLNCMTDEDESVYSVDNSYHFLRYTYMKFTLPELSIRPQYKGKARMAWCHNVGTNIIEKAVFKEGQDVYQRWDNVWADIYFQFYQEAGVGKHESHNIGIGNVSCVESWTEHLRAYPINVAQPWFYSTDTALAFPLFYKGEKGKAEHRYTFKRKVLDLLRVQILQDGKWKNVVKRAHKYVNIPANKKFDTPQLWGRYSYITDAELKWHKCSTEPRVFYIRDIESCDAPNANTYNSNSTISLTCKNPCLALFWVAENKKASLCHNYSNYTTDSSDLYDGWDPIKSTTLKYGTHERIGNMSSDHFNISEGRRHFPSCPLERGYHGYSYASDSTSFHGDIGVVFEGMDATLGCNISDSINIPQETEEEENTEEDDEIADILSDTCSIDDCKELTEKSDEMFTTRVRLLVMKKMTITQESDGSYSFSVK